MDYFLYVTKRAHDMEPVKPPELAKLAGKGGYNEGWHDATTAIEWMLINFVNGDKF